MRRSRDSVRHIDIYDCFCGKFQRDPEHADARAAGRVLCEGDTQAADWRVLSLYRRPIKNGFGAARRSTDFSQGIANTLAEDTSHLRAREE